MCLPVGVTRGGEVEEVRTVQRCETLSPDDQCPLLTWKVLFRPG